MTSLRRLIGAASRVGLAALLMVSVRAAHAGDTYSNDFAVEPREGWSQTEVKTSPTGEQFLGSFGNNAVSLTLTNLREHTHVVIALDLYVIGSWGGIGGRTPASFGVTLDNSRDVLRTTFSNDDDATGRPQTYPEGPGLLPQYPRTGSFSTNTLGFVDPSSGKVRDTTYRLIFNVRHSGSTMVVSFEGSGLPDDPSIMWGIDNVYVATYTMDLNPVPNVFTQPAADGFGSFGDAGSNPVVGEFIPVGDLNAPGGPSGSPPPPSTNPFEAPLVPTPGSAAVLALGCGHLLRRPRREACGAHAELPARRAA
jgi:hypothetical protein